MSLNIGTAQVGATWLERYGTASDGNSQNDNNDQSKVNVELEKEFPKEFPSDFVAQDVFLFPGDEELMKEFTKKL